MTPCDCFLLNVTYRRYIMYNAEVNEKALSLIGDGAFLRMKTASDILGNIIKYHYLRGGWIVMPPPMAVATERGEWMC